MDVSMLIDSADCFDECKFAEGKAIKVTKGGKPRCEHPWTVLQA